MPVPALRWRRSAKALRVAVFVGIGAPDLVPVGGAQLAGHLPLDWPACALHHLFVAVVEADGRGVGS